MLEKKISKLGREVTCLTQHFSSWLCVVLPSGTLPRHVLFQLLSLDDLV